MERTLAGLIERRAGQFRATPTASRQTQAPVSTARPARRTLPPPRRADTRNFSHLRDLVPTGDTTGAVLVDSRSIPDARIQAMWAEAFSRVVPAMESPAIPSRTASERLWDRAFAKALGEK